MQSKTSKVKKHIYRIRGSRNQPFSLMSVQKILTTKNSKISTTSTKTIQRSTDKMKRNQKLKNSEDRS